MEPTPLSRRWRARLTVVANVVFVGGFVIAFVGGDVARSIGSGFMTIGTGALLHGVAQSLKPAAEFQVRLIFMIVGLGFLLFGATLWLLAD